MDMKVRQEQVSGEWKRRDNADTETWERNDVANGAEGYASKYKIGGRYNWQAIRHNGEFRISGTESTIEDAMRRADEMLALPIEHFNAMVADELERKLWEIERQILKLTPSVKLLPGYHAGYSDGVSAIRSRLASLLAPETDEAHTE